MKHRLIITFLLIGGCLSYTGIGCVPSPTPAQGKTSNVAKGPLTVFSVYEGKIEARRDVLIMSGFRGNATVIELASDGAKVSKGDLLVRFDSSAIERDILKLERSYTLSKAELEGLEHARLPLEIRDLEVRLMKARTSINAEEQYLDALIQLHSKEDLISEQEIEQQKMKVAELSTQLKTLEMQMNLTKEYLHPSALKHGQSNLSSLEQELKLAREQLESCVVRAPSDGTVIYKPLHIGTEFRTIRIGDSIFPNQTFMILPDMSDMVVHCDIPESELSLVQKGKDSFIYPISYPDMRLRGAVEEVGSMAQNKPGQPMWQKFFHVVIGLKEGDSRLKPGMSVTAHILSYHNPNAILIPRAAVRWDAGKPFVRLLKDSSQETRWLKLGMANEGNYEVIEGLKLGEAVLVE